MAAKPAGLPTAGNPSAAGYTRGEKRPVNLVVISSPPLQEPRAEDGIRTRDPHLGKVMF